MKKYRNSVVSEYISGLIKKGPSKKAQAAMEIVPFIHSVKKVTPKTWVSLRSSPRKKKGQAAMEFLLTYGWAILAVLVALSALAYFGVLNPSNYTPNQCTLPTGLSCIDYTLSAYTVHVGPPAPGGSDVLKNKLIIEIKNNRGWDYVINSVQVQGSASLFQPSIITGAVSNGDEIIYTADPFEYKPGQVMTSKTNYNLKITINSQNVQSDLSFSETGSIVGNVD